MATATWTGEVEMRTVFFPTGEFKANGEPKLRKGRVLKIHLRRGCDLISFNVTHRTDKVTGVRTTSITDHREKATGTGGTQGIWGTRDKAPVGGKTRSYTPSGWASEVERYVGWSEAVALLMEAGVDF